MNTRTLALACALALFCAAPSAGATGPTTAQTSTASAKKPAAKAATKPGVKKPTAKKRVSSHKPAKKIAAKQNPVISAIRTMVLKVRAASIASFKMMKELYFHLQPQWAAKTLDDLQTLLAAGKEPNKPEHYLVPLPANYLDYNICPRLVGPYRIGQADKRENQPYYLSLRPSAMGAMLYLGSQLKTGCLDVTSMSRHEQYTITLRRTNPNAKVEFRAHTMGIAFDVGLAHTSKNTAEEILNVLTVSKDEDKVLFGVELRQLCFHITPKPEAEDEFEKFYWRAVGKPQNVTIVALQP